MSSKSASNCVSALRRAMRAIRGQYSRSVRSPRSAKGREWLLDNYYLLAREGAAVLKALRACPPLPVDVDGKPRLLGFFGDYIRNAGDVDTHSLASALAEISITSAETEQLRLFWSAALILSASRAACAPLPDTRELG
ncbi:MAG: hypothetical protein LBT21_07095, partial [Oscillospiraceae bacterium]|nr:hypothetical protein [Oscillospiraceae bacterium]